MTNETIMLAKTYKQEKDLHFPVHISEKLDGVPGKFYLCPEDNTVKCVSRQGERILSVEHICEELKDVLYDGLFIIGELYNTMLDFKDISGLVRRQYSDERSKELVLCIHDSYTDGEESMAYETRMAYLYSILKDMAQPKYILPVIGKVIHDYNSFVAITEKFQKDNPKSEGLVIRAMNGNKAHYKAGWRSPGILKMKTTCTIDLPIAGFEVAVDKHGEKKGMVGRINVYHAVGASSDGLNDYTDFNVIGVGPGKLTHKERTDIWNNQEDYIGKMIEIKYMPDDSYEALREPRFYRFRPDKD